MPINGTESPDETKLLALYHYEARAEKNLSFEKNDVMYLLNDSDKEWWLVKHSRTNQTGYVPKNFVKKINSLESEEWFAGRIPRSRGEAIINNQILPSGTFMIREKESALKEYVLTVKYYNEYEEETEIRHYEIKKQEDGKFYVTTKRQEIPLFSSLKELVSYYKGKACGLCCTLTTPMKKMKSAENLNWDIPRKQLQLKKRLGDGNFGEVWYGTWRGIVEVAIKTLKNGNESVTPETFLKEAKKLRLCKHPNILKLYAVCSGEEPFYIVTEFMCNGALQTYLENEKNDRSLEVLVNISFQISNGMKCLEEMKLVHRDLAARNVLLGERVNGVPMAKIADFGLAYSLTDNDLNADQTQFPTKWAAPEILHRMPFTNKSDVWSYGVVLFEIFSHGATPYEGIPDVKTFLLNGHRLPKPAHCPSDIYTEVMQECWLYEAESRPTFMQLHKIFEDYTAREE